MVEVATALLEVKHQTAITLPESLTCHHSTYGDVMGIAAIHLTDINYFSSTFKSNAKKPRDW
jgi:hypothetical protein